MSLGICGGIITAIAIGIIFELAAAVAFVVGGVAAWSLAKISVDSSMPSQEEVKEFNAALQKLEETEQLVMNRIRRRN